MIETRIMNSTAAHTRSLSGHSVSTLKDALTVSMVGSHIHCVPLKVKINFEVRSLHTFRQYSDEDGLIAAIRNTRVLHP
jgi:hypothetical protein